MTSINVENIGNLFDTSLLHNITLNLEGIVDVEVPNLNDRSTAQNK